MRWVLAAMLLALATGCAAGQVPATAASGSMLPPLSTPDLAGNDVSFGQFTLEVAAPDDSRRQTFRTYDADDAVTRARGFMEVEEIPDDVGMIFRFGRPQEGGFWMLNVVVPLSVAFADSDGVIVDILHMEPCPAQPCPTYRPDALYEYAFEVRQGVFEAQGIEEGWKLDVPADLPAPD